MLGTRIVQADVDIASVVPSILSFPWLLARLGISDVHQRPDIFSTAAILGLPTPATQCQGDWSTSTSQIGACWVMEPMALPWLDGSIATCFKPTLNCHSFPVDYVGCWPSLRLTAQYRECLSVTLDGSIATSTKSFCN